MKNTVFVLWLGLAVADIGWAQNEPYKNPDLSPRERAEDLLKRLTLKEKVSLMINSSPAVERLGIKPYNWWSEALHGVARSGIATVYPITMGMASVFPDEAVEAVYTTVSDEARAKYHDAHKKGRYGQMNEGLTFWTPNVNIFRDPRWGRGQETWARDLGRRPLPDFPDGCGCGQGLARSCGCQVRQAARLCETLCRAQRAGSQASLFRCGTA